MTATMTQQTVLRLERLIAATPDHLFDLWTKPEMIAQWFGPEASTLLSYTFDVRSGGQYRVTMRAPDGIVRTVSGVYLTIERPRKIVFSWAWDDDKGQRGHETDVTITFAAAPGGTLLTLVQQEFETEQGRDLHGQGWTSTFVRLEKAAVK
jgi:uncharacterized protein YndB with AHSA1/START domain